MKNLNQAVIFCGGLGTRLGKLTKNLPKPMIEVCNKPFLEHIIIQLKKNGIKNIVLLVGYKSYLIKRYFSNGKKFGVKIKYSYNPPNIQTGNRLYDAKKYLNKKFLLLYSDNYTSLNIHKLNFFFEKSKKKIQLSLVRKKKGNCKINKNYNYTSYFGSRSKKNKYVEIGYMIIDRTILKYLKKKEKNFSNFLVKISKKKLIGGIIFNDGYLSIGDRKRLKITRKFFSNNNIVLIDRDGVLNQTPKNTRYVTNLSSLKINSKICKKLPNKAKFLCISNQAGLSTGDLNYKNLKMINKKLNNFLGKYSIKISEFFISHHHYLSNSDFRKPNPGLFLKAANKYKFILDKTFYIGDDKRDVESAYNANTYIFYVGKKKLNKDEKKKYKFVILKKNIIKLYNEKIKFNF